MKLSVLGLSGAIALASLMSPVIAATDKSGGFSKSTQAPSFSRRDRDDAATQPPRQNGGFSTPRAAPSVVPPRQNGGFTAQSTPPVAQRPGANGFGGGPAAATAQRPPVSAVDRVASRTQSQAAFKQFQQERAVYKAPPVAEPINRQAAQNSTGWRQYGSGWHDPDAYYRSRNNAFDRNPGLRIYYERPPVWVQQSSPSYGWIAAGFLGGVLLDRATQPGYGEWAYSHQSDPGYEAWHRDMMQQATDNEELRTKMAALDAQVAQLQAQNAPKTEALPPDVDPSLVVAPSTALIATTDESDGFPWGKTILGVIVVVVCLLGLCIFISFQRKRAIA